MKKKVLLSLFAAGLLTTSAFGVASAYDSSADGWPTDKEIDKILDDNLNEQFGEWDKATKEGKPAEMTDFTGKVRKGSTEDYIPGLDKKLEENVAKGADKVLDKVAEKSMQKPMKKMMKKPLPKTSAVK